MKQHRASHDPHDPSANVTWLKLENVRGGFYYFDFATNKQSKSIPHPEDAVEKKGAASRGRLGLMRSPSMHKATVDRPLKYSCVGVIHVIIKLNLC
jgi:hypothetical protein